MSDEIRVKRLRVHPDSYDALRLQVDTFCRYADKVSVWPDHRLSPGIFVMEGENGVDISVCQISRYDEGWVTWLETVKTLVDALRTYANGEWDGGENARLALAEIWKEEAGIDDG